MSTTSLPLLAYESHVLRVPTVSSITFYNSAESADGCHAIVQTLLQARLDVVTALNPWLHGQLHYATGGGLVLDVPTNCQPVQLVHQDLPQLSPGMPYDELTKALEPFTVLQGVDTVDKPNQTLFRVMWITISPTQGALYMSMSHVLGDGYTYYRLFSMLSSDRKPAALTPHRRHDLLTKILGQNDSIDLHRSGSMLWHLVTTAFMAPAPSISVHTLSNDWIAAQKEAALPAKVSTNDVITAWLFNLCRADVGLMAVNCRERYADVTQDLAGNYSTIVAYQPDDYASPALIRQSLQAVPIRRVVSREFAWMFNKTTAMVTSWASIRDSAPPNFPQWTPAAHFPIANLSYVQPYTNVAIVFRKSPTEVGVILRARATVDPHGLANATQSVARSS